MKRNFLYMNKDCIPTNSYIPFLVNLKMMNIYVMGEFNLKIDIFKMRLFWTPLCRNKDM